jgi:hypothetical protein
MAKPCGWMWEESEVAMELIGVLTFGEGQYWVCNGEEAWAFPLQVGAWVEVLVGANG